VFFQRLVLRPARTAPSMARLGDTVQMNPARAEKVPVPPLSRSPASSSTGRTGQRCGPSTMSPRNPPGSLRAREDGLQIEVTHHRPAMDDKMTAAAAPKPPSSCSAGSRRSLRKPTRSSTTLKDAVSMAAHRSLGYERLRTQTHAGSLQGILDHLDQTEWRLL